MLAAQLAPVILLAGAMVYAGVEAGANAYQIKRDYDVSHTWETRGRMVALGFMAGFAAFPAAGSGPLVALAYSLLNFAMAACAFGFWFDIRLNRRRGLPWHYVGTDPQTAATDKAILGRIPGRVYAVGKGVAALLLCGLLLWLHP